LGGAAVSLAGFGAPAARACGMPSSPSVPPGGTCSHRPAMPASSSSSSSPLRDEGVGAGARGLRCCGAGCQGADAAGTSAARRAESTSSAMDVSVSRCWSDRLSSMAVKALSSAPAAHALTATAASEWRRLSECAGAAAELRRAVGAAAPERAVEAAGSGDAPGETLSQRPAMPPASSKSSMRVPLIATFHRSSCCALACPRNAGLRPQGERGVKDGKTSRILQITPREPDGISLTELKQNTKTNQNNGNPRAGELPQLSQTPGRPSREGSRRHCRHLTGSCSTTVGCAARPRTAAARSAPATSTARPQRARRESRTRRPAPPVGPARCRPARRAMAAAGRAG